MGETFGNVKIVDLKCSEMDDTILVGCMTSRQTGVTLQQSCAEILRFNDGLLLRARFGLQEVVFAERNSFRKPCKQSEKFLLTSGHACVDAKFAVDCASGLLNSFPEFAPFHFGRA